MKTLERFLNEKLVINKNAKSIDYLDKLSKATDANEFYEVIAEIAETAGREPDIYDDSEDFDVYNYFEPWEDSWGDYDETYEILKSNCNDNGVIGWNSSNGFEEIEKIMPPMFNDIMDKWKHELLYEWQSFETHAWENKIGKTNCILLKVSMGANNDGADYIDYWYLFVTKTKF